MVSTKTILFVGTLDKHHYYKGVETFIKALTLIKSPFKAYIVGGGGDSQKIKRLVSQTSISSSVIFTGKVSNQELIKYYHQTDVFVLPSSNTSEGFGIVLLESLSQGTPVITTTAAGASTLLKNQQFASIIPPNDPHALTKHINQIPIKSTPNKSAIKFSHQFTLQKLAQTTEQVYKQVLK